MKKLIKSDTPYFLDVDVLIIPKYTNDEIAAASYKGFNIPDGEVISGIKGAIITGQIESDYEAFIQSIEGLLTEYYGLILTYQNKSEDYSHYYNFLAKDPKTDKVLFKFRLRLRISNHPAHRSKESQLHKKDEENTDKYMELTKNITKDPRPYVKHITVNKEIYASYELAFLDIDKQISEWIDVMRK